MQLIIDIERGKACVKTLGNKRKSDFSYCEIYTEYRTGDKELQHIEIESNDPDEQRVRLIGERILRLAAKLIKR